MSAELTAGAASSCVKTEGAALSNVVAKSAAASGSCIFKKDSLRDARDKKAFDNIEVSEK